MSYKKASYVTLIGLIVFSTILLVTALKWTYRASITDTIGPDYFPIRLSILLIALCIISLFTTWRKKTDHQVPAPNKAIYLTILLVAIFLVSWSTFGFFYINLFLLTGALLFIYMPRDKFKKQVILNITVILGVLLFIYLLFDYTIGVRL